MQHQFKIFPKKKKSFKNDFLSTNICEGSYFFQNLSMANHAGADPGGVYGSNYHPSQDSKKKVSNYNTLEREFITSDRF
jgi:hypothetical protein